MPPVTVVCSIQRRKPLAGAGYLLVNARRKTLRAGIAVVPSLLTLALWITFRVARRARPEAGSGERFAWTLGRVAAFGALVSIALIAFPAALFALAESLLVVPWPISWPVAAALLLTGAAGIDAASLIFSNSPRRKTLIRRTGLINAAVLAWSSLQLMMLPAGPPELFQAGIKAGAGRFEKKLLLNVDGVGSVTDIEYGDVRGAGVELSVAGNYGARFFSRSLQPEASVKIGITKDDPRYLVDIVPQGLSNSLMFYRHNNWSMYDSLFDAHGKELWRTPRSCLTGARITVSGESSPEFLCVQYTPQCCTLVARNVGNMILWDASVGWVFDLAFLGPSALPAIVIDQPGVDSPALMGLDFRGQPVFTRQPLASLLGGFSAVHWPRVCEQCLLVGGNDRFSVLTPDGTRLVISLAPALYLSETRSVAVRLTANGVPMLAVIGQIEYKSFGKMTFHGALFIFDATGSQVYSEVFPERAEAIAAMPTSNSDRDVLLVGGENKVWEYSASEFQPAAR